MNTFHVTRDCMDRPDATDDTLGTLGFGGASGAAAGVAWQLDDEAPMCGDCKAEFGLFTRRHHCRRCGKIFCGDCLTDAVTRGVSGARPTCQGCLAPCIVAAAPAVMSTAGGTLTLSGYNFAVPGGAAAGVALGGAQLGAPHASCSGARACV